jgi:hypothetical protein
VVRPDHMRASLSRAVCVDDEPIPVSSPLTSLFELWIERRLFDAAFRAARTGMAGERLLTFL